MKAPHEVIVNRNSIRTFLFALMLFLVHSIDAQRSFSTGYYITDSNDTIYPNTSAQSINPPANPQSCVTTNVLPLPYNTNNGQRGIMFDVTALNNITISCFDVNMATGTTNVEIYYKVGTHVGFQSTPGAWRLIGSASTTGLGTNLATYVPVICNVSVTAGCTVAFYITRTTSGGPIINYTNGTAVGFVFGSNADLQVKDGTGKDYPFAASFQPRRFNGTIHYNLNSSSSSGVINGPLAMCAGSSQTYTFTGLGWTSYTWTVPAGTTITSGQGTNTINIIAGGTPGNICVTPSGPCGPGAQVCLAVSLAPSPTSVQASTNVTCNGANNGTATITPTPAGAYTYTWSPNVGSTATVGSLAAGTYTVTAANSGGCSTTQTITITQPPAITATTSQVNVLCNGGNTGSATVNPAGGVGGFTFSWNPAAGTSATASSLTAQNYTCTITDANGCTLTQTFAITAPSAITLAMSSTPSTCGNNNGSATVVAGGGAGGYSYSWSSGGTTATESNLAGGTYTVTVNDANGCSSSQTVTVSGSTNPVASISSFTNVSCFGGNNGDANASVAGGQGPFIYAWSSGGSAALETGLAAGTYTCTITDANGCITSSTATITEPPVLTASISSTDVLCNAGNTGSATVTAGGGVSGYLYSWSPSGGTGVTENNMTAQGYTVTVTDANGCTVTQSVTITEPTALTTTASQIDELCMGGSNGNATVTPAGGAGGYLYSWNPSGGNAATASSLTAGNYSCTITDANGCTLTQSFNITEPPGMTATSGPNTNILCNGQSTGAVQINANGGSGSYSYSWLPNVTTSSSANGLPAGTYQVTVTDVNGCSTTVTVTLTQPTALTMTATSNPTAVCSGAPVTLSVNPAGGAGGYSVNWMPGNMNGSSQNIVPTATTTYTATVTDANGCTLTANTTATIFEQPIAILGSNITSGCAPVCVNFSDNSTINNPANIASWSWDFGDGNTSTSQNPSNCFTQPGPYDITLTVTSGDGCVSTITMNNYITSFVNPVANFTAGPQPTTIFNPIIYFTDSSTNASSWLWSFGDVNNSTSTLQNPSFTYNDMTCFQVVLTVTSTDGCIDTTSEVVCIDADVSLYVPNAFTPNGDGHNDVFIPVGDGLDAEKYEMRVFDRWGNQVFYSNDILKGWDGAMQGTSNTCQQDTYVWKLSVRDMNGTKHNLIGKVTLIR